MSVKTRPCEICKQEIPLERLEYLPETTLCAEHARMIEKYGGEFIVVFKEEKLSKAGSLKKNYGSVTPSRLRNSTAMEKLRLAEEERLHPEG